MRRAWRRFASGRMLWRLRLLALAAASVALLSAGQVLASGVTNSGDDLRDGWYPEQSSLTPQLVSGGTFGQMWSTNVDGQVYAQPLLHNGTLLVATENDKVYGLDPATGAMRWPAPLNLGPPWKAADIGCGDLTPNIGITSTPVIDPATNTAYLTHKTYVSGTSGPARWFMDAVDMASGTEKPGFPVQLIGSAQNHPSMTFQPTNQLQRPGLLLLNGVVYAAFGSHCDFSPWQGWVFGVSTAGSITARWVTVPGGNGAGIWQSGAGLTSDGPNTLLVSTGNTGAPSVPTPGKTPPATLGESIVRLGVQPDGSLKAIDFFAPFDAQSLDSWDADFASGGVTGLNEQFFGTPAVPRLAVAVGKDGYVYLLNRDDLGGFAQGSGGSDKVVQRIGPYGGVWSRPGVWPGDGGWVYIPTASGGNSAGGSTGFLRVYQYGVSGTKQPTLSLQASSPDAFGFTSSAPVITSDGTTSGSALVWTVWTPNGSGVGAQLRAYDPVPVGGKPVLRWSGPVGTSSKFAIPGVGAGRLYVGTRDGKVLGFGSPVTPPLTGPATSFPITTVSNSSMKTLTLTATDTLTVSKLTSNSSQFTVGTTTPALPAQLTAGQTIQVPLTFTPTQTGLVGGTLTAETSIGSSSFAMSGTGQAAAAQLEATPPVVSFGGTTVGGHLSGAATFRNVGGAPLTVNAVKLPAAPFGATGAPAPGSTIAAGASVTINVTFDPTTEGNFADEISLETTAGNKGVGLSGSAGAAGVLQITSEQNDFGPVAVGTTASKSFTVKNTGGTNITITKSKPPSGGAFLPTTSLPEGTTLAPGASLTQTVAYTPTAPGYAGASWAINGNDTTGLHEVTFAGTGTVAAPGGAWSHNGAATIAGGVLKTTTAKPNLAGSGFFTTPLDSRHLIVEFDQTIGGGTGADGQALAFADAGKATPASLGTGGGGLGFSGIAGIAVAFDTYKGAGAPSNNFAGISDGRGATAGSLHWLATASLAASLRTATRHMKVEVLSGVISVWMDGVKVLSGTATMPPRVLLGFTGGTGGQTDNHEVSKVLVTGDAAPTGPPPASLKIGSAVIAPAGSPQASTQLAFSGSCPSAFTTAPVGNGGSVTPALTGAVAGASCSVSQAAPAGSGWTTTASVNGGAPVTLSPSGEQLTVPTFALSAATNTVQFTNTYTPATGSGVPDPTAGGWQLNGSAALTASELELTPAVSNKAGSAFWPQAIDPRKLTVEFDELIGGGTGADGLALLFGDVARGATPTSLGFEGGGLGFSGTPGIAVALDTYQNPANPSNNFIGLTDGPTSSTVPDQLHWLATSNLAVPLANVSHHIKVVISGGTLTAFLDGAQVLSQAVALPASAYLGFGGGTGGLNDRHAISHLTVSSETAPPAASLTISTVVKAPEGSPQAATQFTYGGSCPSSFTAGPLGDGGSAAPELSGAVAGASCTVAEAAPGASGWATSVSVNGGAEVPLTVAGGQLTAPAFKLAAGANSVRFTNTYTPPPPPASLTISTVVKAPEGSPQAATQFSYGGSCPSSFAAGPQGSGGSASPALTGAVAGASCNVSEAAPAGTGWATSVSVNGGAEVALTASGGQLTAPAFALVAGANSVRFTNTYTPPTGSLLPDPTAGGWQLNGSAALTVSELVLTTATSHQKGSAFWPKTLDPRTITVEFDELIGGGSGADGLALVFGDSARGAAPTSLGFEGGGLGFSGIPGIAVALDTYKNTANPSSNFIGVSDGPTSSTAPDKLHWLATANLAVPLANVSHHIKVVIGGGTLKASVDGTQVLSQAVTLPASAYLGFGGGTGGLNDRHAISHLTVTSP